MDLVDIPRFEAVLARRPALAERLFGPEELALAAGLSRPGPTLAGRFAVKEATMKVLSVGIGAVDWTDITTSRRHGGAPELQVGGRARNLARQRGVAGWYVTISHTATVAAATVIAVS